MCTGGGGAAGPQAKTSKIPKSDIKRQKKALKQFNQQASLANDEMRSQLQLQIDETNQRAQTNAEKLAAAQQRALEQAGQEIVGSYRATAGVGVGGDTAMQTTTAPGQQIKRKRPALQLQTGDAGMGPRAGLVIGG